MPAPVTVWTVELVPDQPLEEVKGLLSLASDALVFAPSDGAGERRYPLREVVQARRLRGSPVLMILRGTDRGRRRTAFYFVQPPPLQRPEQPPRASFGGIGRSSKRRVRRQNVSYLGVWNREKKALLREWERQVKTAAAAARS